MYFVEAENIVKQFTNHRALDKVSIHVPRGKIFGLLGPNGAGKTTLIRIINRITAPDEGTVCFDGRPSQPNDIFRIGYLPEERGLYKKLKVGEQTLYFAQLKGLTRNDARKQVIQWFEKFDIMPWWNKKMEELSKGMQQKIQFIITVVHQPDLLIFDEPFSGFDPINAELLKNEMLELKKAGHTLIFSTHNMASVEEVCDEIALINQSKVVLNGNVHEIRTRFKSDTFQLSVTDEQIESMEGFFAILSVEKKGNYTQARIQKDGRISNSDLLTALAQKYDIHSFVEELPSMNEVFIQTVRKGMLEVRN
jgi:ABC-2 type transport system ATP-binding protein